MKYTTLLGFVIGSLLFSISCKTMSISDTFKLSKQHQILFLDEIEGKKAIVFDTTDAFFENISALDMQIQMKKAYPSSSNRSNILSDYTTYLKNEVLVFSEEEKELMKGIFEKAYRYCVGINPTLFPDQIQLIKTDVNHYGSSVYYTRENCIIIPQNELMASNEDGLLETMLHEIFHIYSRYNPKKRHELYALIGFTPLGNTGDLAIPKALKDRTLLNPDGANYAYKIDLQVEEEQVQAIPIIISNETQFRKNKTAFFNYLKFDLYEVRKENDRWKVVTNADGTSTLSLQKLTDFFRQIKDNTDYIIHPDEVLADNFMFLLLNENGANLEFSEAGQQLQKDIKRILE